VCTGEQVRACAHDRIVWIYTPACTLCSSCEACPGAQNGRPRRQPLMQLRRRTDGSTTAAVGVRQQALGHGRQHCHGAPASVDGFAGSISTRSLSASWLSQRYGFAVRQMLMVPAPANGASAVSALATVCATGKTGRNLGRQQAHYAPCYG
jgi:hypothetical protein